MHRGHDFTNAATDRVIEYHERKRLAVMGLFCDLKTLRADHVGELLVIDSKHNLLEYEKLNKAKKPKK
jgi:hypothetical protein